MSEPSRFDPRGGVAVITGAAGGIGAALALQLAARGCHLALCDVNATGLEATAAAARAHGVKVNTMVLDMARPDSDVLMRDATLAAHGRVTLLVNNAGVAVGGTFDQVAQADFDWLMSINFGAVVRMTRTFLPLLEQAPAAQLVNISSVFGIIAPPGQTAYCAAKFAVRGFSESLRHELQAKGSNVGVTVVHPGGVRTAIASSARRPQGVSKADVDRELKNFSRLLVLSPEDCAARILRGIEAREWRVLVGKDAVAGAWLQRLFPVGYWKIMARGLARRLAQAR